MSGIDPVDGLDVVQTEVGEWGDGTFPDATLASIIAHLREEVDELAGARNRGAIADECADILLLLLHIAHREDFSLYRATVLKYSLCRSRRWHPPDERGISRHVKENP